MKTSRVSCRTLRGLALAVALAAGWSTTPPAAAAPPLARTSTQKSGGIFGSSRSSQYASSHRVTVPQTYQVQRRVIYNRPNVVTLPPVRGNFDPRQDPRLREYVAAVQSEEASRARLAAASSSRSRLTLPVPADDATLRAVPVPETDSSIEQTGPAEVIKKPEVPVRAEVVIAPTQQGEPEYAMPVFGRRGFVHPPSSAALAEKDKVIIDVRDYSPGEKVKDPRTGIVFLVPPTA